MDEFNKIALPLSALVVCFSLAIVQSSDTKFTFAEIFFTRSPYQLI
jgi:hypothetical protein